MNVVPDMQYSYLFDRLRRIRVVSVDGTKSHVMLNSFSISCIDTFDAVLSEGCQFGGPARIRRS
jgi:hypothetical protein